MEWLGVVGLVLVVGLIVLLYVAAPLLVVRQFWMNPDAAVEDVDPSDLDAKVAADLDRARDDLEPLGFIDLGVFRVPGLVPANLQSVFRLLAHPERHTLAMATWIQAQAGEQLMPPKFYIEFSSETKDGRDLNTNNCVDLPSADQNPQTVCYVFPGVMDLSLLWKFHCGMLRETVQPGELRPIPLGLSPAELLHREFRDQIEEKVARGLWRRSPNEPRFQPTVRGGYIMTWGELPPFKQWRMRRARRAAQGLRRRLGL